MPLSIVSSVVFGADAANSRGAFRRRSAVPPPRIVASAPPADDPFEDAPAEEFDEAEESPPSKAGLSILAQALAAYGEN